MVSNGVTAIGTNAFSSCTSLISVTLGNSVTSIGNDAFYVCPQMTSVTLGNSVISIGYEAFSDCFSLTSVTIPNSVTSIGEGAFFTCSKLTSVTIGNGVTNIALGAFEECTNLNGIYFKGNPPTLGSSVFSGDNNATVYYPPGTTGWSTTFGGVKTWNPQVQTNSATFGVRSNRFGFTINGNMGLVIVVEACTNLANPIWSTLGTNTLISNASYFSDPKWTNYRARFYHLRSP
jgi:hypothetical protein